MAAIDWDAPAKLERQVKDLCQSCRRQLDIGRQCWHCSIRICACGATISTPFIEVCRSCEVRLYPDGFDGRPDNFRDVPEVVAPSSTNRLTAWLKSWKGNFIDIASGSREECDRAVRKESNGDGWWVRSLILREGVKPN